MCLACAILGFADLDYVEVHPEVLKDSYVVAWGLPAQVPPFMVAFSQSLLPAAVFLQLSSDGAPLPHVIRWGRERFASTWRCSMNR